MTPRLAITLLLILVVVPAAHAAASVTPVNAAQWCKAWKNGDELGQFATLYPGGLGYARTFERTRRDGLAKNLFGRCVSLTAQKLAVTHKAAVARDTSTSSRCKADLAHAGSAYSNVGRCVSDRGRQLRP